MERSLNALAPISQLPSEVLLLVFIDVVRMAFEEEAAYASKRFKRCIAPVCLSHVCSSWRGVVMKAPALWTYLVMGSNCDPKLIEHVLKASGGKNVHFKYLDGDTGNPPPHSSHRARSQMQALASAGPQLLSVHLHASAVTIDYFLSATQNQNYPHLESLKIQGTHRTNLVSGLESAFSRGVRNLRYLELDNCSIPSDAHIFLTPTNLTHLIIHELPLENRGTGAYPIYRILQHLPMLQYVEADIGYHRPGIIEWEGMATFRRLWLPNLQEMKLRGGWDTLILLLLYLLKIPSGIPRLTIQASMFGDVISGPRGLNEAISNAMEATDSVFHPHAVSIGGPSLGFQDPNPEAAGRMAVTTAIRARTFNTDVGMAIEDPQAVGREWSLAINDQEAASVDMFPFELEGQEIRNVLWSLENLTVLNVHIQVPQSLWTMAANLPCLLCLKLGSEPAAHFLKSLEPRVDGKESRAYRSFAVVVPYPALRELYLDDTGAGDGFGEAEIATPDLPPEAVDQRDDNYTSGGQGQPGNDDERRRTGRLQDPSFLHRLRAALEQRQEANGGQPLGHIYLAYWHHHCRKLEGGNYRDYQEMEVEARKRAEELQVILSSVALRVSYYGLDVRTGQRVF